MLRWPEIPSCADCKKWHYDTKYWVKIKRGGEPLERLPQELPPCHQCPKGPEPFKKELTDKNRQAIWYYQQCKSDDSKILPRDEVVVRNNAMVRIVEERVHRSLLSDMAGNLQVISVKPI